MTSPKTLTVPFSQPTKVGTEQNALSVAWEGAKFSGDAPANQECKAQLKDMTGSEGAFLTPSCTSALEMALLLARIEPGDEVIVPSFTFTSTATAVSLFKGVPVFVDVRPDTLNMDETLIEQAITPKTKAIMPVHYAGVAADMDAINAIAKKHNLIVIEDAAQGIGAAYKGRPLGGLGDMGAISFHDTKNITCGEGGALLTQSKSLTERGEIIAEKGTNRQQFFRGEVDKYSWQDYGSSYLISAFQAAVLLEQLKIESSVTEKRLSIWNTYKKSLKEFEDQGLVQLPKVPKECTHNGHLFYVIFKDADTAQSIQKQLKEKDIQAVPHYVPLHASVAGQKLGRTPFPVPVSEDIPHRLLRLPLFYNMSDEQLQHVIDSLKTILKNL